MDVVFTDAALFHLVVSFQSGLPGRLYSYWQQHRTLVPSPNDLGETGTLVAIAIRRGDIAVLTGLYALFVSSSYYRSLPLLQFQDAIYYAAHWDQETVLKWLHSTSRNGVTCDAHAASVAVREGNTQTLTWLFLNCTSCTSSLTVETAVAVAQRGHNEVIQCLYAHRPELFASPDVLKSAVLSGQLKIVQFLHEQIVPTSTGRYCKGLLDKAAAAGQLRVLQYLDANCSERATTDAMDVAAANGHLNIVEYLHTHRNEGCTVYAMDQAAAQGHLEVVRFLDTYRREGCTVYAMGGASRRGHLDVVRFLHEHRTEGCSSWALAEASEKGRLDVVAFLHTHKIGMAWEDSALFRAARNGHLDVVEYLCTHTKVGDRVFDARRAAKTAGYEAIVRVLDKEIKKLLEERDQEQREKLRRRKHAKAKKKRK